MKQCDMKAYGGVDAWLHFILTSAVFGDEWSASLPGRLSPKERASDIHRVGGWVDLVSRY
jgi:hypothetical protein